MRVLFVVPPLTGHTNPTVAVGGELARRGHAVAWCGDRAHLEKHLPAGATIIPASGDLPPALVDAISTRSQGLRGAAALKFLWEDFLEPLARATVEGVTAAVKAFDPDVMVVDQQAVAGALVARSLRRLWVTSATTSADLVDAFEGLPKLREWVDEQLVALQVDYGVDAADARPENLRLSPYSVLAFTTEALAGPLDDLGVPVTCVGPAFVDRPAAGTEDGSFPWDFFDGRPVVLVSLGTVNVGAGERFFTAAAAAFEERPHLQGVFVCPPELLPNRPGNVLAMSRVPQIDVLGRCSAVVSHGGHNTVCETLAHRLPLVLAPIRDDQPIVAGQVVAAGAGIRLKFSRVNAADLGRAIDTVLTDPTFAAAAGSIATSFNHAGGAAAAADHLESLVASHADQPQERTT